MKRLILLAALLPAPAFAAELWCMPQTICRGDTCHATTDEESSIRFADLEAAQTTMRAQAEDVPMTRTETSAAVEWTGTNEFGLAQHVIWIRSDNSYTFTVTASDGSLHQANGYCEVQ